MHEQMDHGVLVGRNPSWATNRPLPMPFASKAMVTMGVRRETAIPVVEGHPKSKERNVRQYSTKSKSIFSHENKSRSRSGIGIVTSMKRSECDGGIARESDGLRSFIRVEEEEGAHPSVPLSPWKDVGDRVLRTRP
jgi:hypothetical protein